ncbi:hypothetical protein [Commensalibacter oyaizuii]|uniref:Uncharacterized protein n=1 Tax=Commensalibacter oyaizuii TaxID=3043873 RepID=A0ABT6Q3R2_9PROT|nr:hypothetical protein [Commensalibacter sp. TBRC 16381]MDI2091737.1 hypothetical protein [Commensalibacter sp. TBRC 16381]
MHFMIEDHYKKIIKQSLVFAQLFEVYKTGHLPCEWERKGSVGKVMIY